MCQYCVMNIPVQILILICTSFNLIKGKADMRCIHVVTLIVAGVTLRIWTLRQFICIPNKGFLLHVLYMYMYMHLS